MSDGFSGSDRHLELIDVIHRVRNRWRMRLALRGVVVVVAGTLLALLLSASSLEALRFSPTAIISFRVTAFIVFAGLVWIGLVRPLHAPGHRFAGRDVSRGKRPDAADRAAERGRARPAHAGGGEHGPSPRLIERLVEQAIDKCRELERRQRSSSAATCDGSSCTLGISRGGGRPHHRARAGISAAGALGAAHHLAQRRGRQPVQD